MALSSSSSSPAAPQAASDPTGDLQRLQQFASERNEQAFAQIVQQHAGPLLRQAQRVLGPRGGAEDAVQETFLRLLGTGHPPDRCVGAWLRKVALQVAIDLARSEKARHQRECTYGRSLLTRDRWQDPGGLAERLLAELPPTQRALLHEHYLEGRTLRELAERRGVSAATMSRQVRAAVERLRQETKKRGLILPAPAFAGLLVTHFAQGSAAAEAAATTASTLLAVKITAAVAIPVMASAAIGSLPAETLHWPDHAMHLSDRREQLQQSIQERTDRALAHFVQRHSGYVHVPGYLLPRQSLHDQVFFFRVPDARLTGHTLVILGNLDLVELSMPELAARILDQTGQPLTALLAPPRRSESLSDSHQAVTQASEAVKQSLPRSGAPGFSPG